MASNIGEEFLGEFARHQLETARRDPRVDRERGAMVADFYAAMDEAERWREMTTWGLRELAQSVERAEKQLGVQHDDTTLSDKERKVLQSAWERAEMARAEIANEYPYVHASALISMHSALDALVEELVPSAQQIIAAMYFDSIQGKLTDEQKALWKDVPDEHRDRLEEAMVKTIADMLPQKPQKPMGTGASRYEAVLARAGLQAKPDRPIPPSLDEALTELGALRHVLVHRGGRVDAKALLDAPTLSYKDGEFVRLTRDDYRRYSAAARAYGVEITQRLLGGAVEHDLTDWQKSAYITA